MGKRARLNSDQRYLVKRGLPPEMVRHLPRRKVRPPYWPIVVYTIVHQAIFFLATAWAYGGFLERPAWLLAPQILTAMVPAWFISRWYIRRWYARQPDVNDAITQMLIDYSRENSENAHLN